MADSTDTRALTRLVGARDTGIGLAMVLAPAGTARRLAVGARVLSDWTDAVVLSRTLAGRGTRAKVVGFAVLWGAFCATALVLDQTGDEVPFVSLDGDFYKLVGDFDKRFPEGAPSLREAESFTVEGDWTFGKGVRVVGDVALGASSAQRVEGGTVLSEQDRARDPDG